MFCWVADDVSNLCAGGTQNAKPKNLWRQASKLCSQFSFSWVCCSPRHELPLCVSYWISQQIWSIGYCRSQRSTSWFIHKTELNLRKILNYVLNPRRLGVNVFHFVPLNSKRSTLNFCLKIISSTLYMLHGLHRDWKLSWSHSFTATIVYRPVKSVNPFDFAFLKM